MVTNARFDAGRFCPSADDAASVLLEEGISDELTRFAARNGERYSHRNFLNFIKRQLIVGSIV